MKSYFPLFLMLTLFVASCESPGSVSTGQTEENSSDKSEEVFDYGSVVDNVYENSFFGFSVPIPVDWKVQDQETTEELAELGSDLITGNNEDLRHAVEVSKINTAYLLTVFKHDLGADVEFNPSFIFVGENLQLAPSIKDGKGYLDQSKKLLMQADVNYEFPPVENVSRNIGGIAFDVMQTTLNMIGLTIYQDYYSIVKKGFALSFIVSYIDAGQKAELDEVLDQMNFQ